MYGSARKLMIRFLLLLMLGNSSYALEIVTHASHSHAANGSPALQDMSSHAGTSTMHHGNANANVNEHALHDEVSPPHSDEDCICDDVCCISSVNVTSALIGTSEDLSPTREQRINNLYQSIAIDLLLPPPTA